MLNGLIRWLVAENAYEQDYFLMLGKVHLVYARKHDHLGHLICRVFQIEVY